MIFIESFIHILLAGEVTTIAGLGANYCNYIDGPAKNARFCQPFGINVNPITGDIYIADTLSTVIRVIDTSGCYQDCITSGHISYLAINIFVVYQAM